MGLLIIAMRTSVSVTTATATMIWLGTAAAVLSSVVSLATASGDNGSSSSAGGLDMLPFPEGKKERKEYTESLARLKDIFHRFLLKI